MSVCAHVKSYARQHEWVSDLFSILAVALLFGSIWVATVYQPEILGWIGHNAVLHTPLVVAALIMDVGLIFACLCIGSARCPEDQGCFRTFRGRRHGAGGIGTLFRNWIHHIEQVGKSHR